MEKEVRQLLRQTIDLYMSSFEKVLYEDDTIFLEGMKDNNLAGDDPSKYQYWEWTQGVGLYGYWKLYKEFGRMECLEKMTAYYDRQLKIGLPAANVNTTAPLLAMSYLAEDQGRQDYMEVCTKWAKWIMDHFPRTKEGGFQHMTSDSRNEQELWDDTLFMTVLFLANMGRILGKAEYLEEAEYQFLLHIKYLTDRKTGLWFHGFTFLENHNFAEALWGRGNCWITAAIPDFLEMTGCQGSVKRMLSETLKRQAQTLIKYQDAGGMWHTLTDDPSSYLEASATCGFAYGILKGIHMGILDESYRQPALKAVTPILKNTDEEGILHQVSYGTAMGRESRQFYKDIPLKSMPYGQALAILFLLEVLKEEQEES